MLASTSKPTLAIPSLYAIVQSRHNLGYIVMPRSDNGALIPLSRIPELYGSLVRRRHCCGGLSHPSPRPLQGLYAPPRVARLDPCGCQRGAHHLGPRHRLLAVWPDSSYPRLRGRANPSRLGHSTLSRLYRVRGAILHSYRRAMSLSPYCPSRARGWVVCYPMGGSHC